MPKNINTLTFFYEPDDLHCSGVEALSKDWAKTNNYLWVKQNRLSSPFLKRMIPKVPALFTIIKGKGLLFTGKDCLTQLTNKLAEE